MSQVVYVLTLKTWTNSYHWYGRIHWDVPSPCSCDTGTITVDFTTPCITCGADHSVAGFQSDDSLAQPDAEGFCSIRHDNKESAIDGARRWFMAHAKSGDVLVLGEWALYGWVRDYFFEILEGYIEPYKTDLGMAR
jgi:hypothetical protein